MKSVFDKGMLICDLIVVSIWLYFTTWYTNGFSLWTLGVVIPLAAARLMVSFGLYYQVQKILWVVLAYTAIIALAMIGNFSTTLDIIAVPFLKFLRCTCSFITGEEGYTKSMFISHFLQNRNQGIYPEGMYIIALIPTILFCAGPLCQIIWYSFKYRAIGEARVSHPKWPWIKLLLGFALYGVCAAALILCAIYYRMEFSIYYKLALSMLLVGFIAYAFYKGLVLTTIEKVYIIGLVSIAIASEGGYHLNAWFSLIAMVVSTTLITWYFFTKYNKYTGVKIKSLSLIMTFVAVADISLWLTRYMTDTLQILALVAIVVCAVAAIILLHKEKISTAWSIAVTVFTVILLPILSIGYNPFACIDTSIVKNASMDDCKYKGLLVIENQDGFGLRDRYGFVLKPGYQSLEYMSEYSPLLLLEDQKGEFGVFNFSEGRFITDCKYTSILPRLDEQGHRQRVWNLISNIDGEEKLEFLKFDRGGYIITDDPIQYSYR